MITPHVQVGNTCENCGTCCGGTCVQYASCRKACYPCCTESVQFAPNLELPVLYPVAIDANGFVTAYLPSGVDPVNYAVGVTLHPVVTNAQGRLVNFRSVISYIPGCGEYTGVIFTSGEFPENRIAGGDQAIIAALLSQPSFAKRLPNGYIRIL